MARQLVKGRPVVSSQVHAIERLRSLGAVTLGTQILLRGVPIRDTSSRRLGLTSREITRLNHLASARKLLGILPHVDRIERLPHVRRSGEVIGKGVVRKRDGSVVELIVNSRYPLWPAPRPIERLGAEAFRTDRDEALFWAILARLIAPDVIGPAPPIEVCGSASGALVDIISALALGCKAPATIDVWSPMDDEGLASPILVTGPSIDVHLSDLPRARGIHLIPTRKTTGRREHLLLELAARFLPTEHQAADALEAALGMHERAWGDVVSHVRAMVRATRQRITFADSHSYFQQQLTAHLNK